MGIYIPNMQMPKVCIECPMEYDNICCNVLNKGFWTGDIDEYKEKLSDCPLVELPPHGRLIDADALPFVKAVEEPDPLDYVRRYAVDAALTIIPADPEEGGADK